jgi:Tfp pilus assembly protein PilF
MWNLFQTRVAKRLAILVGILLAVTAALGYFRDDLLLSYRISAARKEIRHNKAPAALALLAKSARRGKDSPEWHMVNLRAYLRSGNLAQAKIHRKACGEFARDAASLKLHDLLIEAQDGKVKHVEGALVELLQSGLSDEEAEDLYDSLARSYLHSLNLADAEKCLKFWTNWQPNNVMPHIYLAELRNRLEEPNAAIEEYRKVLSIEPDNQVALLNLAVLTRDATELEEAEVYFRRFLEQDPHSAEALMGLAECERRQGDSANANEYLLDALVLEIPDEKAAAALTTLGQIALEDKEYFRAKSLLQHATDLDSREPRSQLALGASLAALGDHEAAKEARDRAKKLSEQHHRLIELTRLAVAEPQNADLRAEAGTLLLREGFHQDAANWYRNALQIDPQCRAAHQGLADYFKQIGDEQQSAKHRAKADESPGAKLEALSQPRASS